MMARNDWPVGSIWMPRFRKPSRARLKRTVLASNEHPNVHTATSPHPVPQISEAFPLLVLSVVPSEDQEKCDLVRQELLARPKSLDILRFLSTPALGQ